MDQLNPDQQEQPKRAAQNIYVNLSQAGDDEETACAMDRPKLLEDVARTMMLDRVMQIEVAV